MATIKRNGAKVVLKDGKVSCGCCFNCLAYGNYPPTELFNKFQFEDLPSELTLAIPRLSGGGSDDGSFIFTKPNSLEYVGPKNGSGPSFPVLFKTPTTTNEYDEQAYNFITISQLGSGSYMYITLSWRSDESSNGYTEGTFNYKSEGDINKLFREPINDFVWSTDGGFIYDDFANSFVISSLDASFSVSRGPRELSDIFPGVPPSYPPEQMVLPTFFCNNLDLSGEPTEISANITYYSGDGAALYFDYIVNLTLDEDIIVSDSCKWKIKTPDGTFEKSGTQDTPVGSYGGGYTVS